MRILKLLIFILPSILNASTIITQKAKAFTEQGFWRSRSLYSADIEYRLMSLQLVDEITQLYFVINYSKGVDYFIYFKREDVEELLESFQIFRLERDNLLSKNEWVSYYLGYLNVAYLEESVQGVGARFIVNPQIDYSIYEKDNTFYYKLMAVNAKDEKGKDIRAGALYLSSDQISSLEKFITDNQIFYKLSINNNID